MVERFSRWLVRRPVAMAIVMLTLVLGATSYVISADIPRDDDVLAFLPESNPDVQAFRQINKRFGSTDIALIGIPTEDPFDPAFLARLRDVTEALRDTEGIDSVLSLTNVNDYVVDPEGGVKTDTLVSELPTDEAQRAALRTKVMSRDHIVGTLISDDADAVLVYAFSAPGQQPRDIASRVREKVLGVFPNEAIYWGGAPFYSTAIYDATERDMARLTPWSIATKMLILTVAFRSVAGMLLGLLVCGIGLVVAQAAMVFTGVPFNVVLSSMPIILIATGTAYAIHMLSQYNRHAADGVSSDEAVVRTMTSTAPSTLVAGLTTVACLASFVTMDIQPMREFGMFTALGLFVALVLSLTFVPAVIALFPRPQRPQSLGPIDPVTRAIAHGARANRMVTGVLVALAVLGAGWYASKLETRMDVAAFFTPGSDPDRAQAFLRDEFGGSDFIQILVEGDLTEPEAVREIGRIGDRIAAIDHVANVQSVEGALAMVGEAMAGARRVPDTKGQTASLFRFLAADRASTRLVSSEEGSDQPRYALMQVKIGTTDVHEIDTVLERVETLVATEAISRFDLVDASADADASAARFKSLFTARLRALGVLFDVPMPPDLDARVDAFLAAPDAPADPAQVATGVETLLLSGESWVTLTPDQARAVATAVSTVPADASPEARSAAIATALGVPLDDALVADLLVVLDVPLGDIRRAASAGNAARALIVALGVTLPVGDAGERFVDRIASNLLDRAAPQAMVAAAAGASELKWTVNGTPVLYRGLSSSVAHNTVSSMLTSLGLVVLIITALYRSPLVGLLATAPTAVTLLFVYGAMSGSGIYLDIGTSMIAALILGIGVDYSVHFLWNWTSRDDAPVTASADHAIDETGHAIWTNALAIGAGFFVLTLGEARPLQNVGLFTAVATVVAAVATFVVVPLFAGRRRYHDV